MNLVREFSLGTMIHKASSIVFGPRASGKSRLCQKMIEYHKNVPACVVVSQDEEFYSQFVQRMFIHDNLTEDLVENIHKRQHKMHKKKRVQRMLLVIDDIDLTKQFNIAVRGLFVNSRVYRMDLILTQQSPILMPPDIRSNFDYVFLLPRLRVCELKKIHQQYESTCEFREFQAAYQVVSQKGYVMVVNLLPHHHKQNNIYWFDMNKNDVPIWRYPTERQLNIDIIVMFIHWIQKNPVKWTSFKDLSSSQFKNVILTMDFLGKLPRYAFRNVCLFV